MRAWSICPACSAVHPAGSPCAACRGATPPRTAPPIARDLVAERPRRRRASMTMIGVGVSLAAFGLFSILASG